MKRIISLIILIILLTFTTSFALVEPDEIVSDIAKSINEHPEHWIDTGSRFVYSDDSFKMKQLKKLTWPEHESELVFIYHIYTTFNYVQLQKPFEYDFEGDGLKDLVKAIKLYKLNRLMKEVGHLLEKNREPMKEQIKPQEEKTIEGDYNKL